MPLSEQLSERELRVLEAVVQTYIETAEPAGSQTIARKFGLGVSPATIRSTMSELEDKGFLFHPHTSAGRIPTDRAYRVYVDAIMRLSPPSHEQQHTLRAELAVPRSAVEEILRRAAQVLGVLTQELGVAVAPALDQVVLERLELVQVSSERLLLVFNLRSGVVRTIFVEVPRLVAPNAVQHVAQILNQRLAGLTLKDIRGTLSERLRDCGSEDDRELLNIFIAEGDGLFDLSNDENGVVLGSAQMLADQPEFASNARMRELLRLTEGRDLLKQALESRHHRGRKSRCQAQRFYSGHLLLPGRQSEGSHRRDGPYPHALR
jgi:heat-inducible transcriptional repressor